MTVSDRHTAEVTILETFAYSEEKKDMPSPLEKLQTRLWQLKICRKSRKDIATSLDTRQAILDSRATSTFMRPQDGAIPTGEKSTKRVSMPDGRAIQASENALLP